jgi:hypothetical protein
VHYFRWCFHMNIVDILTQEKRYPWQRSILKKYSLYPQPVFASRDPRQVCKTAQAQGNRCVLMYQRRRRNVPGCPIGGGITTVK